MITENSIIKQVPCGLPSGAEVVRYFGFLPKFDPEEEGALGVEAFAPLLIVAGFLLFFQLLACIFFVGKRQVNKMSRSRKAKL